MSNTDPNGIPTETGLRHGSKPYVGPTGTVMLLLVILDLVGVGLTEFAPQFSHWYWLAMVIVTGIACTAMAWSRAREAGLGIAGALKNEVLFWFSVLVAVNLVYLLFHAGRLDSENTGLIILLILALATFLAGLRLGWQLCVLGALLGSALLLATYLEEFLWLVLMAGLVAGAVFYVFGRRRSTH